MPTKWEIKWATCILHNKLVCTYTAFGTGLLADKAILQHRIIITTVESSKIDHHQAGSTIQAVSTT